jgi:hypothetical protein
MVSDRVLQFMNGGECAESEPFSGDFSEPSLNLIEVEGGDVAYLGHKFRISTEFQCLQQMRLASMLLPDSLDRCRTNTLQFRHCPHTPARSIARTRLQGLGDQLRLWFRRDLLRPAGARMVLQDSGQTLLLESAAPKQDRRRTRSQFPRQHIVADSIPGTEDNIDEEINTLPNASQA